MGESIGNKPLTVGDICTINPITHQPLKLRVLYKYNLPGKQPFFMTEVDNFIGDKRRDLIVYRAWSPHFIYEYIMWRRACDIRFDPEKEIWE